MSTITSIAATLGAIEEFPSTARQVRDASDDLISHELIRPGRPGHAAETRDAREGAFILLSSLGAPSARTAGRFAKRLQHLSWVHGLLIDPAGFAEDPATAGAVALLKQMIGMRSFIDTQAELLRQHRQLSFALSALQAKALEPGLSERGNWRSFLAVDLHIGERITAEITAGVSTIPAASDLQFETLTSPISLFEIQATFSDGAEITEPLQRPVTHRVGHKVFGALGAVLAG